MVFNKLRKEISEPLKGYSDHPMVSGRVNIDQLMISTVRENSGLGIKCGVVSIYVTSDTMRQNIITKRVNTVKSTN